MNEKNRNQILNQHENGFENNIRVHQKRERRIKSQMKEYFPENEDS